MKFQLRSAFVCSILAILVCHPLTVCAAESTSVFAQETIGKVVPAASETPYLSSPSPVKNQEVTVPTPPVLNVHGYLLEDVYSEKELASQNPDKRMAPASLTKLMTLYLTFEALEAGRIHLTDLVTVSARAWKTGGSRMFIKVGDPVSVSDLIRGVITDSGNDACMALAEYIGGSEENFVNLMNKQAVLLEMKNTHYKDSTGLPDPEHYTTPQDMAKLTRAIILNFPQYYPWFSEKTFTYNKITQPNRNRLLWQDTSVDGLKTGHTDEAGYCLIASAKRQGMRLMSIVFGAPSDKMRTQYAEDLLNYGFRYYETHKVYTQHQIIEQAPVYFGKTSRLSVGIEKDFYVTTLAGQYTQVNVELQMQSPLKAPIKQGQKIGTFMVKLKGNTIAQADLVALEEMPQGNIFSRLWDYLRLMVSKK